ncbi:aryl-alcohol oxidase-like protein [Mycena maculata]|uniref:Aryl-alcohol oxidase-like protein n=1 Tax=Mycena maculata TaxID=230809 RepID=A0AAD7IB13_9AGAR|nr:aryl-alcohol oxidase-like protein [Mycena maculata]
MSASKQGASWKRFLSVFSEHIGGHLQSPTPYKQQDSTLCRGALYENVTELQRLDLQFDFIIDDYDRFARVTGDEGWSWDCLIPYMRKNERFTPPADHHNTSGQFNPAVHGFDGINSVTLSGFPSPIDLRVLDTTQGSSEWPFNLDVNSGYQLGVGWVQETVKDGSKSSSATSYLAPEFISRPNLHVLLHARVTRVLPSGSNTIFRTVEFVQNLQGERYTMTAKKELVLSAGSVGTPNILMHSGIGNSSALASLGIAPLHDLPPVGQNLSDHPLVELGFLVNSNNTYETAERNATVAAEQLAQWITTRTGPLVDNPSRPNAAHYEFLFSNGLIVPPPPTGNFLGIMAAMVSPVSRGSITLNSSDPLSPPVINPKFFSAELDLFIMREAMRSALRFATAPTDVELDEYTRDNADTVNHVAGTAVMISGLRIVDLSIVPFISTGHTQAATYIIAERAADLIKEAWN